MDIKFLDFFVYMVMQHQFSNFTASLCALIKRKELKIWERERDAQSQFQQESQFEGFVQTCKLCPGPVIQPQD